ncbi:MAG TPA: transglutaminase family protein, partial [Gemmatimonadales bacterium]|nr:transglutaminase family protein [Gemmatimonadales bacterium]
PGESHAWVEAAVPGLGWVELDPTHPDPAHEEYVRLAVGRDYADVPPLRGSYVGPPTEEMSVAVTVSELPA